MHEMCLLYRIVCAEEADGRGNQLPYIATRAVTRDIELLGWLIGVRSEEQWGRHEIV